MTRRSVLFVDDEAVLLDTYRRLLERQYDIHTAQGPVAGLEMVKTSGPFAVIVSDLRMPGMGGIEFLSQTCILAPETVRVMLTGFANTGAAVAAVNEGRIFRFLNKPCPHPEIVRTLDACIEQYELVVAERELLENTLAGSVRMLVELVGVMNPGASGRATRIQRTIRRLTKVLQIPKAWQVELAGMLSQIGTLTIAPEITERAWNGEELTELESALYASHPVAASQLLAKIPRLGTVAKIISRQLGDPAEKPGEGGDDPALELTVEMLRVAVRLDQLTTRGYTVAQAIAEVRRMPHTCPAEIVVALEGLESDRPPGILQSVGAPDLVEGMVIAEDVRDSNGGVLVPKGREITTPLIVRLRLYDRSYLLKEPIRVWASPATPVRKEAA